MTPEAAASSTALYSSVVVVTHSESGWSISTGKGHGPDMQGVM